MTKRSATSLIELLVVMSACTIILTMSASLVHRAMHAQSATRSFFDGERSAMRLSEQFRADVHEATAVRTEKPTHGNGEFLRLRLPDDESIEYRQIADSILRVLSKRDAVLSRAEFAFPSSLKLAVQEVQLPQRVVLTISAGSLAKAAPSDEQQPPSAYAMPLKLEIAACLNRDAAATAFMAAEKRTQ